MMYPKPTKRKKVKKPLVRVKKTSRGTLSRKADKLFSEKIRSLGKCQLKGIDKITCNGNLQCAHIVGRANHRLRWEFSNALSLCQAHHLFYTHQPWAWQELIQERFPFRYKWVNDHRNEPWDKDLEKVLNELT